MLLMQPVQHGAAAKRFYAAFLRLQRSDRNPHNCSIAFRQSFNCRQRGNPVTFQEIRSCFSVARARPQPQKRFENAAPIKRCHSSDSSSPADNEVMALSTHVRKLMRHVPHPVVVITATEPLVQGATAQNSESALRAMTASSFNTVALEPTPIVSFNVKTPSSTYDALRARGTFLVHFLAASPAGARIADAFTRGRAVKAFADLTKSKVATVYYGKGTNDAPLIAGDGVTKVLRCRLLKEKFVAVGDHVVVLGEVLGIIGAALQADGHGNTEPEGLSLVYADQCYREVGSKIEAHRSEASIAELQQVPMQRTLGLNLRRGDEGRP